jgi:hypothetical protein
MSDNKRPPNRRFVEVVYPAGTHLDYSRASSNGMRGTVRDDRDNSLIGQAELFDASDRYADGMRQAVAAAAPGLAAAALQLIGSDEALGLTHEQQKYLRERAAELDLAVVEDLTGAHIMPV